jgi:hypothetical protein
LEAGRRNTAKIGRVFAQIVVGYRLREQRKTVINPKTKAARTLSRETVDAVVILAENFPEPEDS